MMTPAEPYWRFWVEHVEQPALLAAAEAKAVQAEAARDQTCWKYRKAENRLERLRQRVENRGLVRWRDLQRLKALKPE